jgi:hypothetical protein
VRVLPHIKKLDDDCFGQFLVRVSCQCGTSRHIEPEALARLVGWSTTLEDLAPWLRCSQCGKKPAEVVVVARSVIKTRVRRASDQFLGVFTSTACSTEP